jgi:Ulp1 family protease
LITKKQCRKLRTILLEMYAIISQGANDIMDIKHGVREILETQRVLATATSIDTGQQDIMDWLLDSNGLNGKQRRERQRIQTVEGDHSDDISYQSDSIEEFAWNEHIAEAVPTSWIPTISDEDNQSIEVAVTTAVNDKQVLTTVGAYEIQTRSIRRLIKGLELDTTVIDGYMSLLQGRSTSRRVKCMGSCFFPTTL